MGTKGLFGYRYQGRYFVKYNYYDSYLDVLGRKLVSYIPRDPDAFRRWLERTRSIIASFGRYFDPDSDTIGEFMSGDETDYYEGLYESEFKYMPEQPDTRDFERYFEWAYTYDLDNTVFSIEGVGNGRIHLRMDNIHRSGSDWVKLIYLDSSRSVGRSPYVSGDFYANVDREELPPARIEDVKLFQATRCDNIDSDTWMNNSDFDHLSLLRKVTTIATEGFISGLYAKISDTHGLVGSGAFEAYAKELLTCASLAGSTFTFGYEEPEKSRCKPNKNSLGRTLWFRGRLVMLAHWLDRKDIFESYVGAVIRRAREQDLKECTAILWSLDHVAVVVISGGRVACSEAIPFVTAIFQKYEMFERGLRLIAHYLPPPCSQGGAQFGSCLSLDIFKQIMDFAGPHSASMLGRTSKALRLEWLKRPAIGHYTLLSAIADRAFLAWDSRKSNKFLITSLCIFPPKYVPNDEWEGKGSFDFSRSLFRDETTRIETCYRKDYFRYDFGRLYYAVETPFDH